MLTIVNRSATTSLHHTKRILLKFKNLPTKTTRCAQDSGTLNPDAIDGTPLGIPSRYRLSRCCPSCCCSPSLPSPFSSLAPTTASTSTSARPRSRSWAYACHCLGFGLALGIAFGLSFDFSFGFGFGLVPFDSQSAVLPWLPELFPKFQLVDGDTDALLLRLLQFQIGTSFF